MMAHIEMKAMEKFPIEKLSYDMKLELLKDMDPRDVIELLNVNQGFRSIIVREPWRIFGKHVNCISFITAHDGANSIEIKKFNSRISLHDDNRISLRRSGSSFGLMGLKSYLTLFSKIRSSQKLKLDLFSQDQRQEEAQLSTKLLTDLSSVGELSIRFNAGTEVNIGKYLTSLPLNLINRATLEILFSKRNELMLGALSNFIETRLSHCKSIEIHDYSSHYSFWYEPFSKIWTEMVLITVSSEPFNRKVPFEELVRRIVTKGIPGSNPEAAILLWDCIWYKRDNNPITGLVSRQPGISQIAHENRGEVGEILEKWLLDKMIPERDATNFDRFEQKKFLREGVYFTRSIDSNRKCIYVTDPSNYRFFAKYVTIG